MKKAVFLMALLAVLLSACAPRAIPPAAEQTSQPPETTAQTEPVQTESAAGAEISWDSPEHAAFQKALIQIHDELYFPELPDAGRIEVHEPAPLRTNSLPFSTWTETARMNCWFPYSIPIRLECVR